ncbi:MAG: hypothetical protein KKH01_05025 [Firmicutes bacterium]|nr:hypothetical protein [Bacillota bacterium]
MKLSEMFKEPINRKDLLPVIKQAVFMSIIGGLLIGTIHLLVVQIFHISLIWMFLFILGITMARRIRDAYTNYHIAYAIIAIVSLFVTYYLTQCVYAYGLVFMTNGLVGEYINFIFNPLLHFNFINILSSSFLTVGNLIDVFFFIVINIYVVRYLK